MSPSIITSNMASPTPSSHRYYFLKTRSRTGAAKYDSLYIRLHGNGVDDVVLTAAPPVFLRAYDELATSAASTEPRGGTAVKFISTKSGDRQWSLALGRPREFVGWEPVQIVAAAEDDGEREGEAGARWVQKEGPSQEYEALEWDVGSSEGDGKGVWKGWMVCEWVHGHPQLFWVTGMLDSRGKELDLPGFCERVELVREGVEG
ncbi:hypothetical protein BU16DRAFT_333636 [Lophium mytilinum]|uniref:DUF7907 domain-containing protein n=1 Tax=Lophium mytilinum TaxID=390894 RepID=A0A6A6R2B8_9PEZI|nr:hypothetical protein BU16DRAFT_333636 [Lophium mytilinum]